MRRLLRFLKDPPLAFAALVWLCAPGAVAGSIAIVAFEITQVWAYAVYVLAAVILAYGIFLAVRLSPRMKAGIVARANRHAFTGNLISDYSYRTVAFSVFSFAVNAGYAIVHIVLAVLWRSVWYGALAGYYLLLSLMRGGVLLCGRSAKKRAAGDEEKLREDKWRIFRACGAALLVLEIALAVFVTQTVLFGRPQTPSLVMAIASAAYTFYRVILSVVQVFRVRKTGDPLLQSLRNINLSNALVSLFALQITLVAVNGSVDEDMRIMNIVTGFLVCALTIALGSYMIIRACRKLGQIRREREVVPDER